MGWVTVAMTPDGVDPIRVLFCDGCGQEIKSGEGYTLSPDDGRVCRTCRPFDAPGVVE